MKTYNIIFIFIVLFFVLTNILYWDTKRLMEFDPSYLSYVLIVILWNLGPVSAFYFMFKKGLPYMSSISLKVTLCLSAPGLVIIPLIGHLELMYIWIFGGGSSTSALGFIFTPLFGLLLGLIPAIIYLLKLEKFVNELK
jgi:hypothetical protein